MKRFEVVPIASENRLRLESTCPHPSFIGEFLATTRTIRDDGFTAEWAVNGLASSARQHFGSAGSASLQTMGVDFIDPVSPYPMTDRALKYGFLFIFLTFAAFFLLELIRELQIHPIQYGFVGLAQAIFFLLMLSLSEHIRFGAAYLIATCACCGIITFYLTGVLGNRIHGLAFGGFLGLLYATLFGLLQSEDHALMAGSVLLFVLLSAVMLFTRSINWYELGNRKGEFTVVATGREDGDNISG
jgi:inner membrane protein